MPAISIDRGQRRVSIDARDPAFFRDPLAAYAEIHAQCPAFFWEERQQWYFAGYDDVNALLRDRRFGRQILHVATREELGLPSPKPHLKDFDALEEYSLLELEPPAHTRLRTLVNRAFVSRQIEQLRPDIERLSHGLIDGFADDGEVELLKTFAEVLPVTIIARMLGIPVEAAPDLLDWSHRMVRMYVFNPSYETELDANRASADFATYLRGVIAEKRRKPGDDLLTHMITSEKDGERLSEAELASTAALLLNAGHEATVHQIGNAVKTILQSRLSANELFVTEAATQLTVEECLRFAAPLHIFQRYALSDVELDGGITLRKGDKIGLLLGAANVDPKKFATPNVFQPTRDEGANVSFGAGLHFCIGAPLARLELKLSLPILFERLPNMRLKCEPDVKDAFHFHGLERLDLIW
ncbi:MULTISPECIES: cytochrome P450 [unclassified Ensifer]|uniref:cytochrome P450 n=1 Tax=unclassified Ensifer TaxID=2633371 RepID=UPI000812CC9D|nr:MULTISPECIES: cytochrome P450 [unclassified Ensifer]OCP01280.1 cytochrome [Ensifer sp. LC14]OCP03172.1 cytochrome [Ensifer sp. LC11]OCP03542.1 cytochrome [Ensifer sp. LC13]OCP33955.1 cytochrome [Ensifer sp. LC499]